MADQGSAEVMGRQARDRPPKGVMDRLNCDIAQGAAEIVRFSACYGNLLILAEASGRRIDPVRIILKSRFNADCFAN